MPYFTPVALALVAACGTSPKDIRDTGIRSEHRVTQPPAPAAACIARNIESGRGYAAKASELGAGVMEVVGSLHVQYAVVVVRVQPTKQGATATIWTRHYGFPAREQFVRDTLKGC
ncbi:MAG: hypothetical protein ACXWUB_04975 [Burkholderiales bacterium]